MNIPDLVNGGFEFGGAIAVWANVRTLYRAKAFKGIAFAPTLFFCTFSLWNLFYYPHLNQWASTLGGAILGTGNTAYVLLMVKYRK